MFKQVLLKLSGEVLAVGCGCLDQPSFARIALTLPS